MWPMERDVEEIRREVAVVAARVTDGFLAMSQRLDRMREDHQKMHGENQGWLRDLHATVSDNTARIEMLETHHGGLSSEDKALTRSEFRWILVIAAAAIAIGMWIALHAK